MKLALKILAGLVGVLVVVFLGLLLLVDANMFKPRLEALAREQGVALVIGGDMDWQLWPALGIKISDVSASNLESPETPLAEIGHAGLRVAIGPLFAGELAVDHIVVENAVFDLTVDEQGRGNWEDFARPSQEPAQEAVQQPTEVPEAAAVEDPAAAQSPTDTADAPTPPEGEGAQLHLAVDELSIRNSTLNFTDFSANKSASEDAPENPAAGSTSDEQTEPLRLSLRDINLHVDQFNLQGEAFPVELQWLTEFSPSGDATLRARGELQTTVQLAQDFSELETEDGQLVLVFEGEPNARLELDYALALRNLQESPRYLGEFILTGENLKQLLAQAGQNAALPRADYALSNLRLSANITGDASSLTLEPFTLQLDKTNLKGSLAVSDFAQPALRLNLQGDQLNVDDYLPPAAPEEATPQEETSEAASTEAELIPLEPLRKLAAQANITFGELTIADIPLQNLAVVAKAENGLVALEQANTEVFGGTVRAKGSLDARGETAEIETSADIQSLQLAALSSLSSGGTDGAEAKLDLSGGVDATASVTTRGTTLDQLLRQARGQMSFTGDQVRVAPLNVEEKFCQIVHAVTERPETEEPWPQYTQLREVKGQARLADQVITVADVTAGVERLLVGAKGTIDWGAGSYDLRLPLTLTAPQSSQNGCSVQSNYWLDRNLSLLRCRGSLEGLNPVSDCRPDAQGLASLVRDFAEYKLKEKHGAKIDAAEQKAEQKLDKQKDELRRKAEEELGEEGASELEQRLKQLLKRE